MIDSTCFEGSMSDICEKKYLLDIKQSRLAELTNDSILLDHILYSQPNHMRC